MLVDAETDDQVKDKGIRFVNGGKPNVDAIANYVEELFDPPADGLKHGAISNKISAGLKRLEESIQRREDPE